VSVRERRALVVVGGGMAGLAATLEAQKAGLQTTLIEQREVLRGPSKLLAGVAPSGAETWTHAAVWGIWSRELAVCCANARTSVISADQIILATGAYERPVAFPGWTLPGVMTAGGAARLMEQGVLPGRRVLVAGYGGWVAAATSDLRRSGTNVVGVIDTAARSGRVVVRAEGAQSLERVVIARVDAEWRARPGTEQVVEIDALVLAFGLLPEDQLVRLAGCEQTGSTYVNPATSRDEWMRTSVPGVLVAGDAGGIVGPDVAIAQGRLAGLAAAVDAGCLSGGEASQRARPIRRRLAALVPADMIPTAPRIGLNELADPDTVLCRCEDVTDRELAERLFDGSLEPGPVIAETRAGMGSCQGRNCATLIAAAISRHTGQPIERVPPITPRPPVVPVPLGALAEPPPDFAPLSDLIEAS
jgi:thioredoxin reductase